MKNKLFSRGMFLEGVRALKVFGLLSLALCVLFAVAVPITGLSERTESLPEAVLMVQILWYFRIISVVCPLIMTFILFSRFNKRQFSDFCHSLPYTRGCIFVSWIFAVFSWMLAVAVISGGLGYVTCMFFPKDFTVNFTGFGAYLTDFASKMLIVTSGALIGISLTGTVLSNITVTGLVLFFPSYVGFLSEITICSVCPLLTKVSIPYFSPDYNLLTEGITSFFSDGVTDTKSHTFTCISTVIIAVLYFVAAYFIFVHRKSETATKSAPARPVQSVIRTAVACVPSLLASALIMIFGKDALSIALIVYIFSAVVFFSYEIITTKKWHNLVKALPTLLIVALVNIVFVLGVRAACNIGVNRTVSAEDVGSVSISLNRYSGSYLSYCISNTEYTDENVKKLCCEYLSDNIETWKVEPDELEYGTKVNVKYSLGNKTLTRNLYISDEDYNCLINAVYQTDELLSGVKSIPQSGEGLSFYVIDNRTFDEIECNDIADVFMTEFNSLDRGVIIDLMKLSESADPRADYSVRIYSDELGGMEKAPKYDLVVLYQEWIDIPIFKKYMPDTFDAVLRCFMNSSEEYNSALTELLSEDRFLKEADRADITVDIFSDGKLVTSLQKGIDEKVLDGVIGALVETYDENAAVGTEDFVKLTVSAEYFNGVRYAGEECYYISNTCYYPLTTEVVEAMEN